MLTALGCPKPSSSYVPQTLMAICRSQSLVFRGRKAGFVGLGCLTSAADPQLTNPPMRHTSSLLMGPCDLPSEANPKYQTLLYRRGMSTENTDSHRKQKKKSSNKKKNVCLLGGGEVLRDLISRA